MGIEPTPVLLEPANGFAARGVPSAIAPIINANNNYILLL